MTIYTVGHSTRPADEFVRILRTYEIELVADIRTIPRSRRNPQYEQSALKRLLGKEGIGYAHLAALGGLRHAHKDSQNTGWRNASFRGYADYMQTPEFAKAVEELMVLASEKRTALLCAEAVPWRCHRSLVGDALLVRGVDVQDILSETHVQPHKLTPWARVEGLQITYPESGNTRRTRTVLNHMSEKKSMRPARDPQEEHDRPENLVEAPHEAEHVARNLEEAADSNESLEGYYAINEEKPPEEVVETIDQKPAIRKKAASEGNRG